MLSSESDSESSYQTDDSDFNYIPQYAIEDAENCENDCNEDEGSSGIIAYADEPLADEAWLANYNREEQERLQTEEKLAKRLDGTVESGEW